MQTDANNAVMGLQPVEWQDPVIDEPKLRAARSGRGNGGRGGGERASAERHAEEETLESCCVIVTIAFKHELLDHMLR